MAVMFEGGLRAALSKYGAVIGALRPRRALFSLQLLRHSQTGPLALDARITGHRLLSRAEGRLIGSWRTSRPSALGQRASASWPASAIVEQMAHSRRCDGAGKISREGVIAGRGTRTFPTDFSMVGGRDTANHRRRLSFGGVSYVACMESSGTLPRPRGGESPPRSDEPLNPNEKPLLADGSALQRAGCGRGLRAGGGAQRQVFALVRNRRSNFRHRLGCLGILFVLECGASEVADMKGRESNAPRGPRRTP